MKNIPIIQMRIAALTWHWAARTRPTFFGLFKTDMSIHKRIWELIDEVERLRELQ